MERRLEDGSEEFYEKVFSNLLDENVGTLDAFGNYRGKILNKLRVKVNRIDVKEESRINVNRRMFGNGGISMVKKIELGRIQDKEKEEKRFVLDDKIDNNPFERNRVMRGINHRNVNGEIFLLGEFYRKGNFLNAQNSILLMKYRNSNLGEIEKTIEKIVAACVRETYEIILYLESSNHLVKFEKILENMFFNFDKLQKVKVVVPSKKVKGLSEMQKLVVLSNFTDSVEKFMFLVSVNSWFPNRYISYIRQRYNDEENSMLSLRNCDMINVNTGRIEKYEASMNKLYLYFVECIFPVVGKDIFKKLNFKAPFLAGLEKFKDFKNFLIKNGTILDVKLLDNFSNNGLHVFEGGN